MEKVSKIFKAIGWVVLIIGLIIISLGIMCDFDAILPSGVCLTTAAGSMLIGMIIEEFA